MASLGPHHNASSVSPPPLPALLFTEQRQKERLREREKVGNSHPVLLYRRQKERETVTRYGYISEIERERNSHPVRLYRRQKERETVTQYGYIGDRKREKQSPSTVISEIEREKQSPNTVISEIERERNSHPVPLYRR